MAVAVCESYSPDGHLRRRVPRIFFLQSNGPVQNVFFFNNFNLVSFETIMRALMRALACFTVTSTSALRVGLLLSAQRSPLAPPSRASVVRAVTSTPTDGTRDLNGRDAEERQASSHVFGQPRPIVDAELSARRKTALDAELALVGIDPAELLADPALASSSGIKAYQTFVAPREAKLEHAANEALEPAAKRTAQQVAFLTRRKRAELAEFVRNHDMAVAILMKVCGDVVAQRSAARNNARASTRAARAAWRPANGTVPYHLNL